MCYNIWLQGFIEVYDMAKDPDQMVNLGRSMDPRKRIAQNHRLVRLATCAGKTCM